MQKPERLIGFVKVDGTDYPFEFDEKTFTLNLYPPSREVQEKKRFDIFDDVNAVASDSHEWISCTRITGVSFGGKKTASGSLFSSSYHYILFDVQDVEANYNGFVSYPVNWYFLYSKEIQEAGISGFKLVGNTINYFYNPEVALQREVKLTEDRTAAKKLSVSSNDMQCSNSCGEYRLTDGITAKISVNAYSTIRYQTASNPIDAESVFVTMFSRPLKDEEIDILLNAYRYTRRFFHYLSRRCNVGLYDVDVCFLNKDNKRDYSGLLVFKEREQEESHKDANQRMIDCSVLGVHSAKLFSLIAGNVLGYGHICKSISDTHQYSPSRALMILAEFEREFFNIYGGDRNRSQEYQEVKQDILGMIDDIISSATGKRRACAKELRKYVANHSNSFQSKIIKALNDCRPIMEPFVRKRYKGEFEEAVDGIGERMGEIRNGLAHSRLSLQFEAIHLDDLNIVEELLYAMRLKTILYDTTIVQKGINNLFGENFAIK